MTSDFPQYRGPLSVAQIAEGMNVATENATRLATDARILLNAERWPTAASVASLSIEEAGKVTVLRRLLTATGDHVRPIWKDYRTHTKKNVLWIIRDLVTNGARKIEDFGAIVDSNSNHPRTLDLVKQLGFYSDCLGDGHWSAPNEAINRDLASSLVEVAEIVAPRRVISIRELELWIEHWNPNHPEGDVGMMRGVADYYAAMQAEGLAPAGPNVMATFLRLGMSDNQAAALLNKKVPE